GWLLAWSWLFPFALVAFCLLLNVNYGAALNYNNLLCLAFTVPRYLLGEFFASLCVLGMAMAYRRWRPQGSLLWLDLLLFALIGWCMADLRLAQIMGARLDWRALSWALGETPRMMWRMASPYLPATVLILCVAGAVY